MKCERIQNTIVSFLKGELTSQDELEMLKHLNECVNCRFVYQDIRQQMQEEVKQDPPPNPAR